MSQILTKNKNSKVHSLGVTKHSIPGISSAIANVYDTINTYKIQYLNEQGEVMSSVKDTFFKAMNSQGLALTFDDVRLVAGRSSVTTQNVDINSRFSKNVGLRAPIASAAMDTVTTADMAIAMAKQGGIGVIHAGLSPEQQYQEVRKVKLHLNGKIESPITVRPDETLRDVIDFCTEKGFKFRSFAVTDENENLLGLITGNAFALSKDLSEKVGDIMTSVDKLTVGDDNTTVDEAYKIMRDIKRKVVPLVDESGKLKGLYLLSDVSRIVKDNPQQYNLDDNGRLRVAAAVPTDDGALERIELMRKYLDVAVVDTAQGDSDFALDTLKKVKAKYPDLDVVIGNISNPDSARELAEAGADGIKIGQGPGSICTTRVETGIGTPQVTAVYECTQAVKEFDIPVCADGGISSAGDVSIAIAAGASCVMIGSGLGGTKEAPGEVIFTEDGKMVKLYRGMGSPSAMRDSAASRKRYGTEGVKGKPLSEGVESHVTYKGPVADVLDHYIKALRKSMSYVGSKDIATHRAQTTFYRITNAGYRESHPHDVKVI